MTERLTDAQIDELLARGRDCGLGGASMRSILASMRSLLEEVRERRKVDADVARSMRGFTDADWAAIRASEDARAEKES